MEHRSIFDYSTKKARIEALRQDQLDPNFWSNAQEASKKTKELAQIEKVVSALDEIETEITFLEELLSLDKSYEQQAIETCSSLSAKLANMTKGPDDHMPCFISIKHGSGGTEACDWSQILLRMYSKFALNQGWEPELIDIDYHDPAGINSAMLRLPAGSYGILKDETGVHRLSRVSPFDQADRRQTSFCLIEVFPDRGEEQTELKIPEIDLEIDYCSGGGPGGQAINKTESVAMIKHLPTGIVIRCQATRTQQKNKEIGLEILKSKLIKMKKDEEDAQRLKERGDRDRTVTFGHRDRSYVLTQGRLVHDHRSGKKTEEVERVLEGELDLIW